MILDMKNKSAFIFLLVNIQIIKKYPGCKSIVNSYTKAILPVPVVEFWQFSTDIFPDKTILNPVNIT